MNQFIFKQKKLFILTFTILIVLFTIIFIVGESSLNIDHDDIHAHVLNHEEIENVQSEDFYRELLNNESDYIFILKKDTTLEFTNDMWLEDFGYYKNEVKGKNFFTFIHEKDLPYFANEIVELVNTAEKIEGIGPIRIEDYNGENNLSIANLIPIQNDEGELIRIGLVLIDVS
jgi:PAS domain S-box-containing protein